MTSQASESESNPKMKPRRQRRDKLPLSEKYARHLEACRNYYDRNKERIREEQRVRSRKYREKLREEKQRLKSHQSQQQPNTCSHCGQPLPATQDDDPGSSKPKSDADDSELETEEN